MELGRALGQVLPNQVRDLLTLPQQLLGVVLRLCTRSQMYGSFRVSICMLTSGSGSTGIAALVDACLHRPHIGYDYTLFQHAFTMMPLSEKS